jgi:hypothetical protein
MKSRLKPVYFENQRQAASLLGLDEYELKEWKAKGCPAFKYGRIYHAELLEWIEAKRGTKTAGNGDRAKARTAMIAEVILALAEAYKAQAITHEQFFDQTTAMVDATDNKEILRGWIQTNFDHVAQFPTLAEAEKAEPKIMRWLLHVGWVSQAGEGTFQGLNPPFQLTRPPRL